MELLTICSFYFCVLHFLAHTFDYDKALDVLSETRKRRVCLLMAIKKLNLPPPQSYLFEDHAYNNESIDLYSNELLSTKCLWPGGEDKSHVACWVNANGNCLFNAISLLIGGMCFLNSVIFNSM